jgi:hypothetical protein
MVLAFMAVCVVTGICAVILLFLSIRSFDRGLKTRGKTLLVAAIAFFVVPYAFAAYAMIHDRLILNDANNYPYQHHK